MSRKGSISNECNELLTSIQEENQPEENGKDGLKKVIRRPSADLNDEDSVGTKGKIEEEMEKEDNDDESDDDNDDDSDDIVRKIDGIESG